MSAIRGVYCSVFSLARDNGHVRAVTDCECDIPLSETYRVAVIFESTVLVFT